MNKSQVIGQVMISQEEIQQRAIEIAAEITEDYKGESVLLVGILRGAVPWMVDVMKHIDLDVEIDFMAVSSYGAATKSSGVVKINKDLDSDIEGRHEFLPQVATSGCKNWVVSHIEAKDLPEAKDANIILVEDTTNALMTLAAFVLDEMKAVKIGVTGSVGKTSTKDMIDAICSQKYMTGKTKGNLNTGIGISMCIFDFQPDTQVAVLEMGTDHPGEIKQVVERFKPHIGVITNIGQSHLEHFGTREGIFRAKLEIAGGFAPDDVLIIQKGKDFLTKEQIISHLKRPLRIVSVGKDMRLISGKSQAKKLLSIRRKRVRPSKRWTVQPETWMNPC